MPCGAYVHRVLIGLVLVGIHFGERATAAENWPQWRGPLANGVAADGDYPVEFSSEQGVAWKIALPGVGCSTPAVWDDSIFLTCGIDGQDGVVSYGMDGSERWRRQLGPERPGKHRNGSGSNPSPVTDGKHVVVYFKSGTVACLDVEGRKLWRVNLQEKYGEDTLWWDVGTSPVLADDRVIVAVMQAGDCYLVALDLATGDVLWKQARMYDCNRESDQAYTTPQVLDVDGRETIVTWGSDHVTGHDPASGKLLWESGGFNPDNENSWRAIGSAAIADGIAVIAYGRGDFLAAMRLGGQGDVTSANRLWDRERIGADVPTPIAVNDRVYVLHDRGQLNCLELGSGREIWSSQFPKSRFKFFASPVLAGDTLYCTREDGTVFVGRVADDQFELLAENAFDEPLVVAPVPLRGGLLIRGREHLFRIASGDEL